MLFAEVKGRETKESQLARKLLIQMGQSSEIVTQALFTKFKISDSPADRQKAERLLYNIAQLHEIVTQILFSKLSDFGSNFNDYHVTKDLLINMGIYYETVIRALFSKLKGGNVGENKIAEKLLIKIMQGHSQKNKNVWETRTWGYETVGQVLFSKLAGSDPVESQIAEDFLIKHKLILRSNKDVIDEVFMIVHDKLYGSITHESLIAAELFIKLGQKRIAADGLYKQLKTRNTEEGLKFENLLINIGMDDEYVAQMLLDKYLYSNNDSVDRQLIERLLFKLGQPGKTVTQKLFSTLTIRTTSLGQLAERLLIKLAQSDETVTQLLFNKLKSSNNTIESQKAVKLLLKIDRFDSYGHTEYARFLFIQGECNNL